MLLYALQDRKHLLYSSSSLISNTDIKPLNCREVRVNPNVIYDTSVYDYCSAIRIVMFTQSRYRPILGTLPFKITLQVKYTRILVDLWLTRPSYGWVTALQLKISQLSLQLVKSFRPDFARGVHIKFHSMVLCS